MVDYITTKQYAALHSVPHETVRTWCKCNKIPFIRVGEGNRAVIMIDRDTPFPAKLKKRTKEEIAIAEIKSRTLKVNIERCYHVTIIDGNGKEVVSDFTFGTKQEAEKLGEKMKKEIEQKYEK